MKISKLFLLLAGAAAGLTLLSGERDGTCTPNKAQLILREKLAELKGEPAPLPKKEDLLADVQRLHREGKISDQQLETFKKNIQEQYTGPVGAPNREAQSRAQLALQEKIATLNTGAPEASPSSTEAQAKALKVLEEQRATPATAQATPPPVAQPVVQPKPVEPTPQPKVTPPPSSTEAQARAQKILDEQRAAARNAQPAPPPARTVARQAAQPKPVEPTPQPKVTPPTSNAEVQAKAQSTLEEFRAREQKAAPAPAPKKVETQAQAQKPPVERRVQAPKPKPAPPVTKPAPQTVVAQNTAAARTPEKTNIIPPTATGTLTPEMEAKARELLRAQIAATQPVAPQPAPAPAPAVAAPVAVAPQTPAPVVAATPPVATAETPVVNTDAQAKALEVLRQQELESKAGVTADTPPQIRALRLKIAEERGVLRPGDVSATAAAPTLSAQPAALTPLPLPSSNKVGLERLAELTQLYKADRISPYDYHHERAKIVATL